MKVDVGERGREADAVRRSAALPLTWNVPDEVQIEKLMATIRRLLDRRRCRPDDIVLEAISMVLLSLQTGLECEALHSLHVRDQLDGSEGSPAPGLVVNNGYGLIVLPTSRMPELQQTAIEQTLYWPVLQHVVLPQSDQLQQVVRLLVSAPRLPAPLFKSSLAKIRKQCQKIMRQGVGPGGSASKATRSLKALGRWLRHRLRVIDGGDPALFSILDPNLNGAERTLSKYFTIGIVKYWRAYGSALAPLDASLHQVVPIELSGYAFGCPTCPNDGALGAATAKLHAMISRPVIDPRLRGGQRPVDAPEALGPLPVARDRHIAMMIYTHALVTFGTGQRGIGHLVNGHAIDSESGFAWVAEKSNSHTGYSGERGVFHCKIVQQQLEVYEDYINELIKYLKRIDPSLAIGLGAWRAERDGLLFFDIRNGQLRRLTQGELCRAAGGIGWPFEPSAGRRWLRSVLSGVVPSDALAAQFGHHLDGLDAWGDFSGLDPTAVAVCLAQQIPLALAAPAIELRRSAIAKRRSRPEASPNFKEDPANNRGRAAQILASAIWNGSFLNFSQDSEDRFLESATAAISNVSTPEWLEMGRVGRDDARRWFVDPTTSALMQRYRLAGMKGLPGSPGGILATFLGSTESVSRFRRQALLRWRFRLPPLVHAYARGALANHSSPAKRFDPSKAREADVRTYPKRRAAHEVRPTSDEFIRFLYRCYAKTEGAPWQRKKSTQDTAVSDISRTSFWRNMTTLERSIAKALLNSLSVNRGARNTRGYSVGTTIARARRLWRDFIPNEVTATVDSLDIDCLTFAQMKSVMVVAIPWVRNVEADIVVLLRSSGLPEVDERINRFENMPQNYTVESLRWAEYEKAKRKSYCPDSQSELSLALTLCYRAGIRYSELSKIDVRRISIKTDQTSLILDQGTAGRLKTFHSRRRIPLDLFLSAEEIDEFRKLLDRKRETMKDQIFSYGLRSTEVEADLDELLQIASGWIRLNTYYLRHSFASNCLAVVLWPPSGINRHSDFFEPLKFDRRASIKSRLCGRNSLGGTGPYAIATVMGHTSPYRTLFSYAHNLEVVLAAHVARWTA